MTMNLKIALACFIVKIRKCGYENWMSALSKSYQLQCVFIIEAKCVLTTGIKTLNPFFRIPDSCVAPFNLELSVHVVLIALL